MRIWANLSKGRPNVAKSELKRAKSSPDFGLLWGFVGESSGSGFWGRNPPLNPPESSFEGWNPSPTRRRSQFDHDGLVLVGLVDSNGSSICLDSPTTHALILRNGSYKKPHAFHKRLSLRPPNQGWCYTILTSIYIYIYIIFFLLV